MKGVPSIITIAELSRLINISRPTLYKYISLFDDNELEDIPSNIIDLFKFIETVYSKDEIYHYCLECFSLHTEKSLIDRVENLLKERHFHKLIDFLVKNYNKLDYKQILKELKETYDEN